MRTIWKFDLRIESEIEIKMPIFSKILSVQDQFGLGRMWVMIDPELPPCIRKFAIIGTGQQMPDVNCEYIGTFQQDAGNYIWHLFELNPEILRPEPPFKTEMR